MYDIISAVTGLDSNRELGCQHTEAYATNMILHQVSLYWHRANQSYSCP